MAKFVTIGERLSTTAPAVTKHLWKEILNRS